MAERNTRRGLRPAFAKERSQGMDIQEEIRNELARLDVPASYGAGEHEQ
jgi:hypothetical protein